MSDIEKIDTWLAEDPELNSVEIMHGAAAHWCVRFMQVCLQEDESHPTGERCVADAEAATLEAAIDGCLLLAREFKDGL